MPKRTASYRARLLDSLVNPVEAAHYLNAAINDSPEMFLKALRNVAQAHQMAKVAKLSGVARENLYRAFSEKGNPTLETLVSVLTAVGLKMAIGANVTAGASPLAPSNMNRIAQANPAANVIVSQATGKILTSSSAMGELGTLGVQNSGAVYSGVAAVSNESIGFAELELLPGFMYQQQQIEKLHRLHE